MSFSWDMSIGISLQMNGICVSTVVKTLSDYVLICLHVLISRIVEVGCSSSTRGSGCWEHSFQGLGRNPAVISPFSIAKSAPNPVLNVFIPVILSR